MVVLFACANLLPVASALPVLLVLFPALCVSDERAAVVVGLARQAQHPKLVAVAEKAATTARIRPRPEVTVRRRGGGGNGA